MPDLDQLLDTLVADVSAATRAPGAPAAVKQARRRRAAVAVAVVGTVAFIAVSGGLATGTLGESDRTSPVGEPTLSPPEPSTAQDSNEPAPGSEEFFDAELRRILTQAPDWAVNDNDPTILEQCGGDWSSAATGGSGGNISIQTASERPSVWHDVAHFTSADEASGAVAALVENLEACTAVAWRTQPVAQSRAVLASSVDGAIWILQKGDLVSTLQAPTTDGQPARDVQVEVAQWIAEWMVAYDTRSEQD